MADIELDQIQGNVFGGFNKDHQVNVLLSITNAAKARVAFGPVGDDDSILADLAASSSQSVMQFNAQFKALRHQGVKPETVIAATWTNVTFTSSGLQKLNAPSLTSFPKAFRDGMRARAAAIGDVGANDPSKWEDLEVPTGGTKPNADDWGDIDVMLIIASDEPHQVAETGSGSRVARYLKRLRAAGSGVRVLRVIRGETRVDDVGHEHFGFKDGVSQPGIRGIGTPLTPRARRRRTACSAAASRSASRSSPASPAARAARRRRAGCSSPATRATSNASSNSSRASG